MAHLGAIPRIPIGDFGMDLDPGPGYIVRDTGSVDSECDEFELGPGDTMSLDPVPLLVREDPGMTLTAT